MKHQGNYTEYMHSAVTDLIQRSWKFYTRENFEHKLKELDYFADEDLQSAYRACYEELKKMCDAYSIDLNALMADATRQQALDQLPTHSQLCTAFLLELNSIYEQFPTSTDFMERLVRRLLDGEFRDDSPRLAILKKFLRTTDYHTEPVLEEARRRITDPEDSTFTREEKETYAMLHSWHRDSYLAAHMKEAIFDVLGAEVETVESDWLNFLLRRVMIFESSRFPMDKKCREALLKLIPGSDGDWDPVTLFSALKEQEILHAEDKPWQHRLHKALVKAQLPCVDWVLQDIEADTEGRFELSDALRREIGLCMGSDPAGCSTVQLLARLADFARDIPGEDPRTEVLHSLRERIAGEIEAHHRAFVYTKKQGKPASWLKGLCQRLKDMQYEQLPLSIKGHRSLTALLPGKTLYPTTRRLLEAVLEEQKRQKEIPPQRDKLSWSERLERSMRIANLTQPPEVYMTILEEQSFRLPERVRSRICMLLPGSHVVCTDAELFEALEEELPRQKKDALWIRELTGILAETEQLLRRHLYRYPREVNPKVAGTWKEKYEEAAKYQQSKVIPDWTLLKLANDLAGGKFRPNGVTREQLYTFAIAFGMRYYRETDPKRDETRDIVKNLFQDFYNDNLLRYILDPDYDPSDTTNDPEPSGEGINYKNYTEAIYLYYLAKDMGLSPRQKLQKIAKLEKICTDQAKVHPARVTQEPTEFTKIFRDSFWSGLYPLTDEQALVDYICSHYFIYGGKDSAHLLKAARRNTAAYHYRLLARQMMGQFPESVRVTSEVEALIETHGRELSVLNEYYRAMEASHDIPLRNLSKLMKETAPARPHSNVNHDNLLHGGLSIPSLLKRMGSARPGGRFPELLEKLDRKLEYTRENVLRLLDAESPEKCTRTKLITLYYCYFLFIMEEQMDFYEIWDFPSVYLEFRDGDGDHKGVNHYLGECGYQQLSEKNAFDMFVVFALYLELMQWNDHYSPLQDPELP